jgi:hypothetical protein
MMGFSFRLTIPYSLSLSLKIVEYTNQRRNQRNSDLETNMTFFLND